MCAKRKGGALLSSLFLTNVSKLNERVEIVDCHYPYPNSLKKDLKDHKNVVQSANFVPKCY